MHYNVLYSHRDRLVLQKSKVARFRQAKRLSWAMSNLTVLAGATTGAAVRRIGSQAAKAQTSQLLANSVQLKAVATTGVSLSRLASLYPL
jgi:hypothetical protein